VHPPRTRAHTRVRIGTYTNTHTHTRARTHTHTRHTGNPGMDTVLNDGLGLCGRPAGRSGGRWWGCMCGARGWICSRWTLAPWRTCTTGCVPTSLPMSKRGAATRSPTTHCSKVRRVRPPYPTHPAAHRHTHRHTVRFQAHTRTHPGVHRGGGASCNNGVSCRCFVGVAVAGGGGASAGPPAPRAAW
jgi:hypothetical protein